MTIATISRPRPTAETLLFRVVLGSARADVVFDHIPQEYTTLRGSISGTNSSTYTNNHAYVECNGDSGTNYYFQEFSSADSGPAVAIEITGDTRVILGWTGNTTDPTWPGITEFTVPGYNSRLFKKLFLVDFYASTIGGFGSRLSAVSMWNNLTPIHTLRFTPQAGNWAAGTMFSIWGVP